MSAATNGTATTERGETTYTDAQRADYNENSRKRIEAVAWRRAFSGSAIVNILQAIGIVVLASHYMHDVFVFREQPGVGISYAGQASQELTLSNNAIASALGDFVACRRDVSIDDSYVDTCVNRLEIMTTDVAPYHVHSDLLTDLAKEENNPKFERKTFTRAVRRFDTIETHIPNTNSWQIQWIEDTTRDGKTTSSLHNGEITIAPNPRLPTDQRALNADWSGVQVVQDELH